MIKEKEIIEARPQIRIPNGRDITEKELIAALKAEAQETGIPIAFTTDQIKFGGFIGGSVEDCIVVYHPDHQRDYFNTAIRLTHQGSYAFLTIYRFGTSRLLGNAASSEFAKTKVKEAFRGGSASEAVGAVIGKGIRTLVMGVSNKQKMEEEQNWYLMLDDVLENIFS